MAAFNTGDLVEFVGNSSFWEKGNQHIINDVSYEGGGSFSYSTNRGAWFKAKDFKLIKRADKATFRQLDKDLESEGF